MGKIGVCERVQISLPLLVKTSKNTVNTGVSGVFFFAKNRKGNQKGNQTNVRIKYEKGGFLGCMAFKMFICPIFEF